MLHVNWLFFMQSAELQKIQADVETFVLRSFWSHNKDCPKIVDEKVDNTVKLLRRLLVAHDEQK
jgi:hypothetical protein